VSFSVSAAAQAASLFISPSSGSYSVGKTLTASVFVSSADQAMNAASGIISFDQNKLEVISLLKDGSIFSLWVQEPSFSNISGTINFEGIVLNPGFIGNSGKIANIVFKTKAAGTAAIIFSSGSILANDGKGTNILTGLGSAQFNLGYVGPTAPEAETPMEQVGTPSAPQIISSTHPDPNKWYQLKTAKFSWQIGNDIIGVRILIDKNPRSIPTVIYTPPISSKEIPDLEEGVWYFHIQLKNSYGWGDISHFRVGIDTFPPDPFTIQVDNGNDSTNPQPTLKFKASDALSGVDHYEIKIGEIHNLKVLANEVENGYYKIPICPPGKHSVIIRAVDKAGNYSLAIADLEIAPIEAPMIINYPKQLYPGEPLIIKGKALANSLITVFIEDERKEIISDSTRSNEDGKWEFVLGKILERGIYRVSAQTTDYRGAKSNLSEKVKIIISPPVFLKIGSVVIDYLSVIITLFALIILMVVIWLYGLRKIRLLQKALKKETKEAESSLYKAFGILKEELTKQVAELDGKPGLSKKEKALDDELKTALNNAEKVIGKEIKDIRKQL